MPRARPGRATGHAEARDGPADCPLAGAKFDRDLIEGHASLVEAAGALDLSLSQAEPAARTATVQMVGDGGSVDAVRLCQRDDALADLMALDQFVDLCGRQKGLSRPDHTHHDAVGPCRSHLAPVPGAGERPPPHARFHGFHILRRVREASHHVRFGASPESEVGRRVLHRFVRRCGSRCSSTSRNTPPPATAVRYVQCGWRRRSVGDPGFNSRRPLSAVVSQGMWL